MRAEHAKLLSTAKEAELNKARNRAAERNRQKLQQQIAIDEKEAKKFFDLNFENDIKEAIQQNKRSISYDERKLYEGALRKLMYICNQLGYITNFHKYERSSDPDDYDGPLTLTISW